MHSGCCHLLTGTDTGRYRYPECLYKAALPYNHAFECISTVCDKWNAINMSIVYHMTMETTVRHYYGNHVRRHKYGHGNWKESIAHKQQ